MEKDTFKLVIPDTPTSLNKLLSMHWAARKRIKDRFGVAVMIGVANSGIPADFQNPPKKIHIDTIIYVSGRGRLPDGDNLCKHLFDSLKDNCVIHDDSQEWLSWTQPIIQRDNINPRTEIFVR